MKTQREILSENLERLIDSRAIDQKVLAEKIGVSETTISNWVRGTKYPRIDKIQALADYFNIMHSDLVTDSNQSDKPSNLIPATPFTVRIPILGSISCGDPLLAEENIKGYRNESPDQLPKGELFYLEANGNSMEPAIPNGSLVLIREQPEVENGQIAAVLVNGDEDATLKRVRHQNGNMILYPENNDYDPIFVAEGNPVRIIGLAVEVKYSL